MLWKILDYIMLLRPTLFFPTWFFFLLGVFWARKVETYFSINLKIFNKDFILTFLSLTLLSGFSYVLNQIYDKESDKLNKKLFLLSEGYISLKSAYIYAFFVLFLSFILILPVFFHNRIVLLFWGLILLFGILYSVPPFAFKRKPILDMLTNGLGYGVLVFLMGYVVFSKIDIFAIKLSISYFLAVCYTYVFTTIPDIEGDKKTGEKTIGVILGYSGSILFGIFLLFLAISYSLYLSDWIVFGLSIVTLPFALLSFFKKDKIFWSKITYRTTGFLLAIYIFYKYPFMLILGLFFLFLMRYYYKRRFGLIYPSFLGR